MINPINVLYLSVNWTLGNSQWNTSRHARTTSTLVVLNNFIKKSIKCKVNRLQCPFIQCTNLAFESCCWICISLLMLYGIVSLYLVVTRILTAARWRSAAQQYPGRQSLSDVCSLHGYWTRNSVGVNSATSRESVLVAETIRKFYRIFFVRFWHWLFSLCVSCKSTREFPLFGGTIFRGNVITSAKECSNVIPCIFP